MLGTQRDHTKKYEQCSTADYDRLVHVSHLSILERILCPQTEQNLAPRSPAKPEDLCWLLGLVSERVHEEV